MDRLRVWAPRPSTLRVDVDGRRLALERQDGGWWSIDGATLPAEADYAFVLDDGEPVPDPRSSRQPHGVHGPSRRVDHTAFPWSDASWRPPPLERAVFYELHVGTFTPEGTFDAARRRLDHLVELGVTHVELMPVATFSGQRGWGYDGVGLFAPHEAYGGPDGLKRLVDACHGRGLAVVLDVVYNHLGPEGNYLDRFGPYFTDRYSTPWGPAMNLDGPDSDEVRRFLCDNASMWLRDYHADGLRIDAVHGLVDTSAVHFLEQLAQEVEDLEAELGRPLTLVAESDLNDPRVVTPRARGGLGLDAQWNDDFHHALQAVLTSERAGYYADFGRLADLAKALEEAFVYDGRHSSFRRRHHGRAARGLSGQRFVGYLQNHDQVGNRARGERIGRLASRRLVQVGAAVVLTAPFVPLLFQGEEWGASSPFCYFTDHGDPELGRAVRAGRRAEFAAFGWRAEEIPDPQAAATFEESRLDWNELETEPHRSLWAWYRRLIRLRRDEPALRDGCFERVSVRFDEERRWLHLRRGPIVVLCNFGPERVRIPLAEEPDRTLLLASDDGTRLRGAEGLLPPESVAILAGRDQR